MIKFLQRQEIHDKKWNGCVHFGYNGLPYGYTWYLDQIAENWDGIVMDDYEAVLPIVWNKKWGICYMYQPLFAQQLGIFSLSPVKEQITEAFWAIVMDKFQFIEIQVNDKTSIPESLFIKDKRINFQLDLNKDYDEIYSRYSGNIKRNLKRARKNNLKLKTNLKPENFVAFFDVHTSHMIKEYRGRHHHALHRLIYNAIQNNCGLLTAVVDDNDDMICAGFFVSNQNRIINLVPSVSEAGKEKGAMTYLFDYIIQSNIPYKSILDFEGSMIPSIARFYKGFGAIEHHYWQLKRNALPWYIRLIKK